MSTKGTITSGEIFHFYEEISFEEEMKEVFLRLDSPTGATIEKDFFSQKLSATVTISG